MALSTNAVMSVPGKYSANAGTRIDGTIKTPQRMAHVIKTLRLR